MDDHEVPSVRDLREKGMSPAGTAASVHPHPCGPTGKDSGDGRLLPFLAWDRAANTGRPAGSLKKKN